MIFYGESDLGCGLIVAPNLEAARLQHSREVGTGNQPHGVREAKREDYDWIMSMGGWVPEEARRKWK